MSKFKVVIEEKADIKALNTAELLIHLAEKHEVDVSKIMIGFNDNAKKELYVWDWDGGRVPNFKTLEIIYL